MRIDTLLIDAVHPFIGIGVIALSCRWALRVERQQKEIDRLRRAIAFYQVDAVELQAELRRSFAPGCSDDYPVTGYRSPATATPDRG